MSLWSDEALWGRLCFAALAGLLAFAIRRRADDLADDPSVGKLGFPGEKARAGRPARRSLQDELTDMILEAEPRIRPFVRLTPVLLSRPLAERTGAEAVFLKLESEQVTGSFKARGASNALMCIAAREGGRVRVTTASTGNHARGVLHAAACLRVRGTAVEVRVFVPRTISDVKLATLRALGATVEVVDSADCAAAEAAARAAAAEDPGTWFVSPYNDREVIAGQGTLAVEALAQIGCAPHGGIPVEPGILAGGAAGRAPHAVLVPVGGGGLLSGVALAVKAALPACKVYACQPRGNACMKESMDAGHILGPGEFRNDPTLSDGTAGGIEPGAVTYDLCRALVDDFLLVDEEDISEELAFMLGSHGKVLEGAAGVALAALRVYQDRFRGQNVLVVCCGGNAAASLVRTILPDVHVHE